MCDQDYFKEDTPEWKMIHDPVGTERRFSVYGQPLPDFFMPRFEELQQWRETFDRRAEFDLEIMEPDLGQPVLEQVKKEMKEQMVDIKQRADKEAAARKEYKQMIVDMDRK